MSLVNASRLHLKVCASLEQNNDNPCGATSACIEKSVDLQQVATFGAVLDLLTSPDICLERQFADTSELISRDTWYFLSHTGRLLGSTDWIKVDIWLTHKLLGTHPWARNQHCCYWCPGAKAPGHQNPQFWVSIYSHIHTNYYIYCEQHANLSC